MADTVSSAVAFVAEALRPFASSLGSDGELIAFVEELGWTLPLAPPSIKALGTTAAAVIDALADVDIATEAQDDGSGGADALETALAKLLASIAAFTLEIKALSAKLTAELPAAFVTATGIAGNFGSRLFEDLLVRALMDNAPLSTSLAALAGLVEENATAADPTKFQPDYTHRALRLDRLGPLVNDPLSLLKDVYGWGTPTLDLDQLFTNIERVSYPLLGPMEVRYPSDKLLTAVAPGAPEADDGPPPTYAIPIFEGGPITVLITVTPLPKATPNELQGIAISLALSGLADTGLTLGPSLTLGLDGELDISAGVAAVLRPDRSPAIVLDPEGAGAPAASGKGGARLTFAPTDQTPLLTGPAGSSIAANSVYFAAGADASTSTSDFYVQAGITGGALTIGGAGADSFITSILPPGGITAHFDFGAEWSQRGGLQFSGGAGLQATIPLNATLGPLTLQSAYIEFKADGNGATLELSVNASASIGPVHASVSRIGVNLQAGFHQGNLGPLSLTFGFKPPTGVGLAIDSAGVTGGGFLAHDAAKSEYSGVLQLKFDDLELQAFGLITTQVAGHGGYSFLALVDADFPPIQLGWGFTLNGVGGLLAINRTASIDALRAAVKAGKLTFLFPKNPITNAAQILGQLDSLFPTAPGRFLFGPMAQIGWGTPTLLTASVAVILELPEPIDIILLANLAALLPNPAAPLVRLNMDALGVLDLTQDDLSLDANLFDSKLISFSIAGDMALRANWSSQREFLLAIGGFHPQFTPPPGFPTLKRITIDMPSGIVSKLRLAAYLAITSNTIQFGATLDAFIGISGCGITGHLGFDALFQLNPFHFVADISGSVAVTVGGDDLASVALDATLSGPAPWSIAGSFKIHIVFFDVSISFSQTWGIDAPSQQTATVDVGALLGAALADPRNWNAQLPSGLAALVATRQIEDAGSILAHPLALLEVHEQIVPLDLTITRFGEAVPSGATTFSITGFHVGRQSTGYAAVQDDFAPAQFFDLSDSDKLSRPSFERHNAGAIMSGSNLVTNGSPLGKTLDYESYFINTPGVVTVDEGLPQPFPWTALSTVMRSGSAARKAISQSGQLRYAAPGNPIRVAEPAFAIADTATLAASAATPARGTTYSDAVAALEAAITTSASQHSAFQIVGMHELSKVTP